MTTPEQPRAGVPDESAIDRTAARATTPAPHVAASPNGAAAATGTAGDVVRSADRGSRRTGNRKIINCSGRK
jgi:hypothetical protein